MTQIKGAGIEQNINSNGHTHSNCLCSCCNSTLPGLVYDYLLLLCSLKEVKEDFFSVSSQT